MKRAAAVFLFLLAIGFLVYVEHDAEAQALQLAKPFTGAVNKAVSGAVSRRLSTMGFAANDPIYGATMAASQTVVQGAVAAGAVATTVAAVGSSPVWLSVALGLGAAYEVYSFTMGQYDYKADVATNNVVMTSGTPVLAVANPPALPVSSEWAVYPTSLPVDWGDPGVGVAVHYPSNKPLCAGFSITASLGTSQLGWPAATLAGTVCGDSVADLRQQTEQYFLNAVVRRGNFTYVNNGASMSVCHAGMTCVYSIVSGSQASETNGTKATCAIDKLSCPEGVRYTYGKGYSLTVQSVETLDGYPPTVYSWASSPSYTFNVFNNPWWGSESKLRSLNDAVAYLENADLAQRADPELLAAIANKIWQQAAQQPGYEGAPYDVNNPVTAADILADIAAAAYPHPTVADLLSLPFASPGGEVAFDPAAAPVAAPAGDPVTVDLGGDPGIASPTLEDPPTGASIVGYVMSLLPSYASFVVPEHKPLDGETLCQMPSFDFFGNYMSMQGACDVIEPHKALLSTVFSAVWAVAALALVMRA